MNKPKRANTKSQSNVDVWLKRETPHVRKALENASRYFGRGDELTVNTLEAVYGEESSFGILRRKPGMDGAAGDFHIQKNTAERYGLLVTKDNDQRFNIDYASITAARYLSDLNRMFGKATKPTEGRVTVPIADLIERKEFVLASYNVGEGKIAYAQQLTQQAGQDPTQWDDVRNFLEATGVVPGKAVDARQYVNDIIENEIEFAEKSPADKKVKNKRPGKSKGLCTNGHWITKDHHHILICD